jgi:hypothetical protein
MRLLILIACVIPLAGCQTNGTYAVNNCQTQTNAPEKHVVRNQYGCILGVDPDQRVRTQIRREAGQNHSE